MKSESIDREELLRIAEYFSADGAPSDVRPAGNGHINDTYLVEYQEPDACSTGSNDSKSPSVCILQRINDKVFRSPESLMDNIIRVTDHLRKVSYSRVIAEGGDGYPLRFIPCRDGSYICRTDSGYWRMMNCVENSYSCETVTDAAQFCEIGRAYGAFIDDMADFPAEELHETIDHFHDTRRRFENLLTALRNDPYGRSPNAREEIRFALEHEKDVDILNDCFARGELPLRVTHNDTKINNVLLSRDTGKALCVIDLDTVMPGLAVNDFGDAIRSGAATGREDEPDADSVRLDMELYEAFSAGFIEGCPSLTDKEIEMLPVGAGIMTLECGLRFLTDYLEGDWYYKTDYDDHNLVRCRTQFRLVRDMEERLGL